MTYSKFINVKSGTFSCGSGFVTSRTVPVQLTLRLFYTRCITAALHFTHVKLCIVISHRVHHVFNVSYNNVSVTIFTKKAVL